MGWEILTQKVFCLLILLLLLPCVIKAEPSISSVSPQQERNVGENALLGCAVENAEEHSVKWVKLGVGKSPSKILTVGQQLVTDEVRYKIGYHFIIEEFHLSIHHLRISDNATYQCQLTLGENIMETANVNLIVKDVIEPTPSPSSPSPKTKEPEVEIKAKTARITKISPQQIKRIGDDVTLECEVMGFDDNYTINWEKVGGPKFSKRPKGLIKLYTDGTVLSTWDINSLTYENNGVYQCQLQSETHNVTANVDLMVLERTTTPMISIPKLQKKVMTRITRISPQQVKDVGENVRLECVVKDVENHTVTWIKAGNATNIPLIISLGKNRIIGDHRYSISYDHNSSLYSLEIENLTYADHGLYQCLISLTPTKKVTANVNLLVGDIDALIAYRSTVESHCVDSAVPLISQTYNFGWLIQNLEDHVQFAEKENKPSELAVSNEFASINASFFMGTDTLTTLMLNLTSLKVNVTQMDIIRSKLKITVHNFERIVKQSHGIIEHTENHLVATWDLKDFKHKLISLSDEWETHPVKFQYQVKFIKFFGDDQISVNGKSCPLF